MTQNRGMTIPFYDRSLAASQELIEELPSLGYTDLWSAEVNGVDGFTPLALAAQWAPGVRLGTAIVPVSTRGPGLLAMSAATLADLAPGRFVLGIGSSSPAIVRRWNGVEFTEPPEERPYGIDCGFRDPSGNHFRLSQLTQVATPA